MALALSVHHSAQRHGGDSASSSCSGNALLSWAVMRTAVLRRSNTHQLVVQLCLAGAVMAATNVPLAAAILLSSARDQVRNSPPKE